MYQRKKRLSPSTILTLLKWNPTKGGLLANWEELLEWLAKNKTKQETKGILIVIIKTAGIWEKMSTWMRTLMKRISGIWKQLTADTS